jgi:hypothetical protein
MLPIDIRLLVIQFYKLILYHLIELIELHLAHNDSHLARLKERIVPEKTRIRRQLHLHELHQIFFVSREHNQ